MEKCKFKSICAIVYSEQEKDICKKCQLIKDIQNKRLSDFTLSMIQKEIDKPKKEKKETDNNKITCPRSLVTKVKISDKCFLKECPYYSEKVSFNCMYIHTEIFFPDHQNIPVNVLEVGLSMTKRHMKRMYDVGIYLSRIIILMTKYYIDMRENEENRPKILFMGNTYIQVCPICHKLNKNSSNIDCDCIIDALVRKRRRNLEYRWCEALKKAYLDYKEEITQEDYKNVTDISFLKGLLYNLRYKDISITDIPFGYLFSSYHIMFNEQNENKCAENFGINHKFYKEATELFLGEL